MAFSPTEIREALEHPVDELIERGVSARITIVGGAAMALVYAPRASTRDVDATYRPVDEVEAAAVGERYGYPPAGSPTRSLSSPRRAVSSSPPS